MEEKEAFNIGDYQAACTTNYNSPSDAVAKCNVVKGGTIDESKKTVSGGEFRALFEFEVERGKVEKADATFARPIFNELKGDGQESVDKIKDLTHLMDANNRDKITLTVLEESDAQKAKMKKLWADVAARRIK